MNVLEVRNHTRRELIVAATRLTARQLVASLLRSRTLRWGKDERLVVVVVGKGLGHAGATAFLRSYCAARAMPGWTIRRRESL